MSFFGRFFKVKNRKDSLQKAILSIRAKNSNQFHTFVKI
ncbi:hypothetical protein FLAVO9AF_150035 [Flavobacterium sp. 9AF]|nr:hypothetical protein FLAVO9AF_150035 [Flavobacterium sp. 9AF]